MFRKSFYRFPFMFPVVFILALSSCKVSTIDYTVSRSFEDWVSIPYRDVKVSVVENDGTFAKVLVTAEFLESPESEWMAKEANIDCRKVGREWQCDTYFYFQLTSAQRRSLELQATLTETAIIESTVKSVTATAVSVEDVKSLISLVGDGKLVIDDPSFHGNGYIDLTIRNESSSEHIVSILYWWHELPDTSQWHVLKMDVNVSAQSENDYRTEFMQEGGIDSYDDVGGLQTEIVAIDGTPMIQPSTLIDALNVESSYLGTSGLSGRTEELICEVTVENNSPIPIKISSEVFFSEMRMEKGELISTTRGNCDSWGSCDDLLIGGVWLVGYYDYQLILPPFSRYADDIFIKFDELTQNIYLNEVYLSIYEPSGDFFSNIPINEKTKSFTFGPDTCSWSVDN